MAGTNSEINTPASCNHLRVYEVHSLLGTPEPTRSCVESEFKVHTHIPHAVQTMFYRY